MSVDSVSPAAVLDIEGTLSRFGGDKKLFAELAKMLLEDAPSLFGDLKSAVECEDPSAVRMRAHALKGVLAGCGGVRAAGAAQLLENAGHSGDLKNAAAMVDTLATELKLLEQALRAYRP